MKIAVDLTDETQGEKGIRIECEEQKLFEEICNTFAYIQPRILEDIIFKTSKRLIVSASYINDLEKTAIKLININKLKYSDFLSAVLCIKNKIYLDDKTASYYPNFK